MDTFGYLLIILWCLPVATRKPLFPIGIVNPSNRTMACLRSSKDLLTNRVTRAPLTIVTSSAVGPSNTLALTSKICELLNIGSFGLIGKHTGSDVDVFMGISSAFRLPLVSIGTPEIRPSNHRDGAFSVDMRPRIAVALFDLIQHSGWQEVYYLYIGADGRARFHDLLTILWANVTTSDDVILRMIPVTSPSNANQTLASVFQHHKKGLNVIVDMEIDQMEEFFALQVESPDSRHHRYICTHLGIDKLSIAYSLNRRRLDLKGFSLLSEQRPQVGEFLKKLGNGSENAWHKLTLDGALAADGMQLYASALTSILDYDPNSFSEAKRDGVLYHVGTDGLSCYGEKSRPWRKGREIVDALKHVTFEGLTGYVAFDANGRRANYTLMLWVTTSYGFQEIGAWDSHNRTIIFRPINETFKRVQRENNTLIVTSILTEPHLMLKHGNYTGNDRFEGYCADLAQKLAQDMNLTFRIVPVADNKYGAQSEQGTWDGMVGELITQKADVAIAPLTITLVRERVIDFTKPFMKLGISIMLKKVSAQNRGFFSFMYPLSTEIWVCVIFAYISVSVVLLLVSRGSADGNEEEMPRQDKDTFTVSDSLWFALGAFMQQGTDKEPRSVTERLAGSVWWFFTLILISSYTANLAAFLTVARMKTAVNSADDLAKQTEIKYGTVIDGSTEEFFETSKIDVYRQMWSFMSQEPNVSVATNEEGVKKVRESVGKYAFLLESPTNEFINEQKPCDTVKVGSNLDSKGYGIATPRGSDLSDLLSMQILILRENGELADLQKKWWLMNSECGDTPPYNPDSNSSLKFSKLAGIFYVLIFGLALGFLVALVEFVYVTFTTRHKSNICGKLCKKTEPAREERGPSTPRPPQGVLVAEPELILLEDRDMIYRRRLTHAS